jgi:hypothetical protein
MAITKKGRSEKIVSVTAVNPTMVRPLQLRNVREIARRRRARSRIHLQRLEWHISDNRGKGQDTRHCLLLH